MRKAIFLTLVITAYICSFLYGAGGVMPGSGTEASPYLMEDFADFQAFCTDSGYWASDVYIQLECDLDLSIAGTYTQAPIAGDIDKDLSFDGIEFTGNFNGNGHIISNLTVSGPSYCGLFGYIGSGGIVTNLGLENASISGTDYYVGGVCGYDQYGNITECYVTGFVSGEYYVGGLSGYNKYGCIAECYTVVCSISGVGNIGGVCGCNYSGSIAKCYTTASVSGNASIGGLCGYQYGNLAIIENCFWDTEVSGMSIGYTINSSHPGKITNVLGLTTTEMQTEKTFTNAGWDFVGEATNGSDDIWVMDGYPLFSWRYIILGGGDGSESNPYLIEDMDDFYEFCSDPNYWGSGVFTKLECDLDLGIAGTYTKAPIAGDTYTDFTFDGTEFKGNFNGNYHIISNLTISGTYYCGLFGCIGSNAAIENLSLKNLSVSGSNIFVGGLCGYNEYGNIINCYSNGSITGEEDSYYVGGLCGYNEYGSITQCYFSGSITGEEDSYYIGGLCGGNESGSIYQCYSTCSVGGYYGIGGLCGDNYGNICCCYTVCSVSGNSNVGGLCGTNCVGSITECYATGNVAGTGDYIGGLCGYNEYGSSISECYATCSVTATGYCCGVGGLSGGNYYSSISKCYAAGPVTGCFSDRVGGLCGSNCAGSITECYAAGHVTGLNDVCGLCGYQLGSTATTENSFWDIEASGALIGYTLDSSGPGIITNVSGLTTSEMQTVSTFTDAGWDFINETENGSDDIWFMNGYPSFSWKNIVVSTVNPGQELILTPGIANRNCLATDEVIVNITNTSANDDAAINVTKYDIDIHDTDLVFSLINRTLSVNTTLDDGDYFMQISIPFTADDLSGMNWKLFDLQYWNGSTWELAVSGNTENSPGHESKVGDRYIGDSAESIPVLSSELGDYGVYYNSLTGKGFVWANVDHTTDFAIATLAGNFYPDGKIDLLDFSYFAKAWLSNTSSESWNYICDIDGSGDISIEDLTLFVEKWLFSNEQELISDHVYYIIVGTEYNYYPSDDQPVPGIEICLETDGTVESITIEAPNGDIFEIPDEERTYPEFNKGEIETCWEYDEDENICNWECNIELADTDYLDGYGSGEYIFTIHYYSGASQQTSVRLYKPYTSDPIVQITQRPVITNIHDGDIVNSPLTVTWQACNEAEVNRIGLDINSNDDYDDYEFSLPITSVGIEETIDLPSGSSWEALLIFGCIYELQNDDGIAILIGKDSTFEMEFSSMGEISDHIIMIGIDYGYDYNSPDTSSDDEYDFEIYTQTDDAVEWIEVLTPAGNTIEIVEDSYTFTGNGSIEISIEYEADENCLGWCYEDESKDLVAFDAYGDGLYTFTFHYSNGCSQQTTAWFGVPDTANSIAQPTQPGVINSFSNGSSIISPVAVSWEPCTDSNAEWIWFEAENEDIDEFIEIDLPVNAVELESPVWLEVGQWDISLCFGTYYLSENNDSVVIDVAKYSETDYSISSLGEIIDHVSESN